MLLAQNARSSGGVAKQLVCHASPSPRLTLEGRTAAGIAAAQGDVDTFEDVVESQGESPVKPDKFAELPLHIAASRGDQDMMKLAMAYEDGRGSVQHENFEGVCPLGHALAAGHTEAAEFLVRAGADVHHRSQKNGNTPTHLAAWCGSLDSIRWLIENKLADLHSENEWGSKPLHMAPPGPVRSLLHRHMRA